MNKLKRLSTAIALLACVSLFSGVASATTLQISLNGVNGTYDPTVPNLCDSTSCTSGNNVFAQGDPLDAVTYSLIPGGLVGIQTGADVIGVDFTLNLGAKLTNGDVVAITSGVFDLFQGGAWGLALDISGGTVTATDNGVAIIALGSLVGSIFSQNLPFGLMIGEPITVGFNLNYVLPTGVGFGSGEELPGFSAQGTADINGEAVPEPGTYALMGAGLLGLAFLKRKKA
jgi:hypothetical protein